MICLTKNWVNFQLLQNPISEHTALFIIVYLKFLDQLNRGANPSPDAKFQVEVAERLSSCERREIDRLGFSRTLSRTADYLSKRLNRI